MSSFPYLFMLISMLIGMPSLQGQSIEAANLHCEYKENPLGLGERHPRLSWRAHALTDQRGLMQSAYRIQVAATVRDLERGRQLLWDSGRQNTRQAQHITYNGPPLASRGRYYWHVKLWDQDGRESNWSAPAYWEMGLLDTSDWQAQWIEPDLVEEIKVNNPSPMLRREFTLTNPATQARLYITSHGLYEVYINGQRVGEDYFTPGWTSYDHRLQYQTYDVADLLQPGANAIAVRLGDGWFRGQFGFSGNWNIYGEKTALLLQLEVTDRRGRKSSVISDDKWKANTGAIRMSSIYDGEIYDARLERTGWRSAGYDDSDWNGVQIADHSKGRLVAPEGVTVRKMEVLPAQKIIITPAGETVVDIGQNMVGWVRLRVKGQAGDTITLHHAEVLDKAGNFYTANLRSAAQKVQYILKDDQETIFEPHFTFQGFRYVKVEGYPGELSLDDLQGIAIYSAMEPSGNFECSHPLINQLQHNIQWGQKGNFLDVPTDCPQRDERMGWTGDAQAFARTACFNFNTAAFYTKWLQDLKADQSENGSVPFVIPDVLNAAGSTGWGDAATIVPWTVYQKYNDRRILERQYQSMKDWVGYLEQLSDGNHLVQRGFHFGDWLFFIHPTDWNAKPGHTDIDFLSTAFFAYSSQLTAQTARVLEKYEEAEQYEALRERIKAAFQHEFLAPSGRLSPHSQTAYTLALAFDLLPEDQVPAAVDYLVKDIEARQYHLSTGFLGTPHLCHVLSEHGHTDVAYRLLLQDTYPSWLYPITRGATTIWERWDGIKPDSTFQDVGMNSFNHYAYGAVGDWMYRVVAGIEIDDEQPGYQHILIQPQPSQELDYARANHQSLHGEISSGWTLNDEGAFELNVRIPPNTTATVRLPHAQLDQVQESGQTLSDANGITQIRQEEDSIVLEAGSGQYNFTYHIHEK